MNILFEALVWQEAITRPSVVALAGLEAAAAVHILSIVGLLARSVEGAAAAHDRDVDHQKRSTTISCHAILKH